MRSIAHSQGEIVPISCLIRHRRSTGTHCRGIQSSRGYGSRQPSWIMHMVHDFLQVNLVNEENPRGISPRVRVSCAGLPDVQVRSLRHRTTVVLRPPVLEFGLHVTQLLPCLLGVRVVLPRHGFLDLDAAFPFPDAAFVGSLSLPKVVVVGVVSVRGRFGDAGKVDGLAVRAIGMPEPA